MSVTLMESDSRIYQVKVQGSFAVLNFQANVGDSHGVSFVSLPLLPPPPRSPPPLRFEAALNFYSTKSGGPMQQALSLLWERPAKKRDFALLEASYVKLF